MKGKKILTYLLALCAVGMLAACNINSSSSSNPPSSSSEPVHTHNWGSEWEKDEEYHWHACEDSSCNEVDSKAEHTGGVATETEQAKCEVCGASYGSLKEHEHAYTVSKVDAKYLVSPADCENKAVYYKSCACGQAGTETFTAGEELGHTWSDWMTKTPATCLEKEVEYRICSMPDCDKEETREGDAALGHNMVDKYDNTHHWSECDNEGCKEATEKIPHSGGEATCLEKAVCEECNQPYGDLAEHAYGEWETKTEADCENAEVEHRVCTIPNCNHEETREGDAALGHEMTTKFDETHHWTSCDRDGCDEETEKVAHFGGVATEEEKAVCEGCNQPYGELKDHTHVFGEWETKTPADCENAEVEHRVCSNPKCGFEETREGDPALGHSYVGAYVDNKDGTHSRLCVNGCGTTSGTENHSGGEATCQALAKCEHCEAEYGELADHAYGEWETKTPADCENAEVEHRVCTTPNCNHEETREGDPALGHTGGTATCTEKAVCTTCGEAYGELAEHAYGDWVVVEPTFDQAGSKERKCECGEVETEEIPQLVKVQEVELDEVPSNVLKGQKVELKVTIVTEGAENYRVEWASDDEKVLKVVKEEGKWYVIGMSLANDVTSKEAKLTATVTNVLGEVDYEAVTAETTVSVVNPIVEYNFDNSSMENTGLDSNAVLNHGGFYTDSTNKVTDFTVNNENVPYVDGTVKINHNAVNNALTPGNHLRLTGVDSNNGDFTISVKVKPDGSGHSSSETYLFGLSVSDIYDAKWGEGAKSKPGKDCLTPFFSIGFEKSNAGNRQLRINLGQSTKRMPTNSMTDLEWSEIRVVKSGLTLTITQYKQDANGDFTVLLGTVVYELTEEKNVYIDPSFSIGFGANYGTGHPGANTYYDDIRVYNVAIDAASPVLNHRYGEFVSNNDGTCQENATETAVCSICGETITRESLDSKTDHTYGEWEVLTPADCINNEVQVRKCTIDGCGHEETKEIENSALGHKLTKLNYDAEGHWYECEAEGCEEKTQKEIHKGGTATEEEKAKCSECGQEYGDVLPHTHKYSSEWSKDETHHWHAATCEHSGEVSSREGHTWDEGTITKPATEQETGIKTFKCTVCEYAKEETIAKLDHVHVPSETWVTDESSHWKTCSGCDEKLELENHKGGTASCLVKAECEVCGESYGVLADHTYGEWSQKTPANCTEAEVLHRVCSLEGCGHEETKLGQEALGHDYTGAYVDNEDGTHSRLCVNGCGTKSDAKEHTGGESTCSKLAVCEHCEAEYGELKEHSYGEWTTVEEPTFDKVGSKERTCIYGEVDTEEIPQLVKVQEVELDVVLSKIIEGQKVELKVTIVTEGAENYRVEWASDDEKVLKVVKEEGKWYVIGMSLANDVVSKEAKLTATVTNVLGEVDYEAVTAETTISVVNPIVEYNFDGGKVVNTGTNQTVTGKVTNLDGNTSVDTTKEVEYVKDSYDRENNAIKLEQVKAGGNHFVVKGIDLGTNDFTIKARLNISAVATNSSSSTYLFGIGNESDANGNVKDVKSPYFNISFKLQSSKNILRFVANSNSALMKDINGSNAFIPYGEWIDVMVIRSENTLTLLVTEVDSGATVEMQIALSSADSLQFTSNCDLAFAGYSGCQNGAPSVNTYYDAIQVFDFALDREGSVIVHNYSEFSLNSEATCTNNETQISTCSVCNHSVIKEIANSSLGHDWDYNDVTITVIPTNEDGLAKMSCTRCEEKHDIVLPSTADYVAEYETYEEGTKLRVNLSVDPSSIDEVVAANPNLDAAKLQEALATFVEAKAPSALGVAYTMYKNGEKSTTDCVVGGDNKAEFTVSLVKDDVIKFYEDENLVVFGKNGIVKEASEFTTPYTGEYKFYINNENDLYSIYPSSEQKFYLLPNANWKDADARFAIYGYGTGICWVDMTDEDADGVYEAVIDINNYSTIIFVRMNPSTTENVWENKWDQTNDLVASSATGNCYVIAEDAWSNGEGEWATYPFHVHSYVEVVEIPATCTETGTKAHYGCESCELKFEKVEEEYVLVNDLTSLIIPTIPHTYNINEYDESGHWSQCICGDIEKVYEHEYVESYAIKEEKLYFIEACECGYKVESEVAAEEECLVDSKEDLLTVIEAGYNAKLTSDVEVETAIVVAKDVTVDLNGKTISLPTDTVGDGVFYVTSGATLTINGEGTINSVGANDYSMAIWADGGHVIINGGTYTNVGASENTTNDVDHFDLIYVKNGGSVTINGGTFINETPRWTLNSHNTLVGTITVKGGTFYGFDPSNMDTDDTFTSVVAKGYYSIKDGDNYVVTNKVMLAEFNFEDGLANTGVESSIYGTGVDNNTDTRYTEISDMSSYIHSSHVASSTTYQLGSNALLAGHNSANPSFGIKGIDTGSGDFAISAKYYLPTHFTNYDKNNQYYIMGTATVENGKQAPAAPCFAIRMGKDSSSAGYSRTTVVLNGETKNLFVSNSSGYFNGRLWVEFRVVKEGTTVTVSIIPSTTNGKVSACSITFELSSVEDFKITPEQVLGFGCNYNVSRPGSAGYYDDIRVWNYAYNFGA